jgi:aspartokinase
MTIIKTDVWEFLDKNPNITLMLKKGFINTRALANHILLNRKINGTIDSVISAIRRYNLDNLEDYLEQVKNKITLAKSISTRSNISNIILIKDSEIQETLSQLFNIINYSKGDILRLIQGDGFIEILVDTKNINSIKRLFQENKIIEMNNDLAEISIHLTQELSKTPGIIAIISNELALNKINVVEILACYLEYTWFIKQEDIITAYQVIYRLCRPNKE